MHGARHVADLIGLRLLHELRENVEASAKEPERVLAPLPGEFFLLLRDYGLQVRAQGNLAPSPPNRHRVDAVEARRRLESVHLRESVRLSEGLDR